jgi:hypothetical protein
MIDLSILLILPPKPTPSQIETAFVLKAVLKLSLGPYSTHRQLFSVQPNILGLHVKTVFRSGFNSHSNFSFSVVLNCESGVEIFQKG